MARPLIGTVETRDGTMMQPDMVSWAESPTRLEEMVWLPTGALAFTMRKGGGRDYTRTGEGEYVRFLEYHRLNPEVFTMVASMAKRMRRAHGAIGARQIMERFRYELKWGVDRPAGQEDFKLNNSHIPFYGRLLIYTTVVPLDVEMFTTRKRGEPGWWVDFLRVAMETARADLQEGDKAGAARVVTLKDRYDSAEAARMRGTDEAPAVVLPT